MSSKKTQPVVAINIESHNVSSPVVLLSFALVLVRETFITH